VSWVAKHPLAAVLGRAAWVAIILAAAGVVVPDPAGAVLAGAAVAVVLAAPLGRVGWLVWTWRGEGDARFARLGGALLAVVATGTILGLVT